MAWFTVPFWEKIKALVRPTTAETRRMELTVKHAMPLQCFEQIMAELREGDADGIGRDSDGMLIPTAKTRAVHKYNYDIKKGSVSDR
eukprot:5627017-Prymnesium_polylepis.1